MTNKNQTPKKDLLTSTSHTWANNPKLLQLLNQIDFRNIKDLIKEKIVGQELSAEDTLLIEDYHFDPSLPKDDAYFSKLFVLLDETKLTTLFKQAKHSFNEVEVEFILDSWNEKERRFAQLRRERDEARAESRRANRLVRSNNNALKALQLDKRDPTLALRMAEANYLIYPESRSAAGIFQELFENKSKAKIQKTIQKGHSDAVLAVAFSPDGQTIFTGSEDNTAKLWDLQGNELQAFQGHSSSVRAVAFSPDGQTILTGSRDNTAKLWDLQGNELQAFQGHSDAVLAVAFSPDGQSILTGS